MEALTTRRARRAPEREDAAATRGRVAAPAPQQERSRVTIDAILDAATRVLEDTPIKELGMRAVARAAGVSAGTLYQYFPNKQSLLHALERQSWERLFARLQREVIGWPDLTAFERTARIVEIMVHEIDAAVRRHGMAHLNQLPPETLEQRRTFVEWLGESLEPLFTVSNAKLLPTNPRLAAHISFQVVMNLARAGTIDDLPEVASGEYAREVGLLIARYLAGPDTPASAVEDGA